MQGISLLVQCNNCTYEKKRTMVSNGYYVYTVPSGVFSFESLKNLVSYVQYIENNRILNLPIKIILTQVKIKDKLVLTLLECLCYYLIKKCNKMVIICLPKEKHHISTEGLLSSPILLLTTGKREHAEKFVKKFERDIYGFHFRRLVCAEESASTSMLSIMFDEIVSFQKTLNISMECSEAIAEVIIELVGNACEHTGTDCLLDIDFAPGYKKRNDTGKYFGINISIINFSHQLFYHALSSKVSKNIDKFLGKRYSRLQDALEIHKDFFNQNYTYDDFCMISAFQHKISGRENNSLTGGTGLTKLIKELQVRSDAYDCYIVSGKRCLSFKSDYLGYDEDNWIGFNIQNDFFRYPPDMSIFSDIDLFLPGTAYNLTFVMKQEDNDGE